MSNKRIHKKGNEAFAKKCEALFFRSAEIKKASRKRERKIKRKGEKRYLDETLATKAQKKRKQ